MSRSVRRDVQLKSQKGRMHPFYASVPSSRPLSEATEIFDTDFEDDSSDAEEYSGRRSEESVSDPLIPLVICKD